MSGEYNDIQIALLTIIVVLAVPIPMVILFVYLCCRKDICHLRAEPPGSYYAMRLKNLSSTEAEHTYITPETGEDTAQINTQL